MPQSGNGDEHEEEALEFEECTLNDVRRTTSFVQDYLDEMAASGQQASNASERKVTLMVEQVLLGALAVDAQDRASITAKAALSRATTSSSLSQEIGELLTQESFFDENDESYEADTDDNIKLRVAQSKHMMQVMLARMLHNIAKANVARKKRRRKGKQG